MTLRARIFAGFALVLVAFIAVAATVVVTQRQQLIEQVDKRLEAAAPLNRADPRRSGEAPPRAAPVPSADADAPDDPISDLYIASIQADGSIEVVVQGQLLPAGPAIDALALDSESGDSEAGDRFAIVNSTDDTIDFRVLIEAERGDGTVVVIAQPLTDVNDSTRQLITTFVLLTLFVAAVLALVAWWIARLGLRPISEMTSTASAIASGAREERVPQLDSTTEAGQLGAAFNNMLDQRDAAEHRLHRFVSDASHELRTPLTSISGFLDIYEAGGFRDADQLNDVVRRMRSEAQRMTGLVETMLQLARLDEEPPIERSPVDLGELVRDVVADSHIGHPGRTIEAEIGPHLPAASVDRDKIYQLVATLVTNALAHAPGANVTVGVNRRLEGAEILVADDGPGMDEFQAQHVFERFYRGDPSRTRASGGAGLGLAIAESIAVAHGGSISLTTAPGDGCEFTVFLPDS